MTTLEATDSYARQPARRRLPAPGRPMVVNVLGALAGLGFGVTVALGVAAESAGSLRAPGGLATAAIPAIAKVMGLGVVIARFLSSTVWPQDRAIDCELRPRNLRRS